MHKELEVACNKMRGTYNKTANQCQIDVTDNLSNLVMSILTKPPKDKEAENHQVSLAKHAPALFLGQPKIHQSPTQLSETYFCYSKSFAYSFIVAFVRLLSNVTHIRRLYGSTHCPCVNNSNMAYSPRARCIHRPCNILQCSDRLWLLATIRLCIPWHVRTTTHITSSIFSSIWYTKTSSFSRVNAKIKKVVKHELQ